MGVLEHLIKTKGPLPAGVATAEQAHALRSLRLALLMLTVCHVVLVPQEEGEDEQLWHFLRDAIALQPLVVQQASSGRAGVGAGGYGGGQHTLARLVPVLNRADRAMYAPGVRDRLEASILHHLGPAVAATTAIAPLVLVPNNGDKKRGSGPVARHQRYRGHPGFSAACATLRTSVLQGVLSGQSGIRTNTNTSFDRNNTTSTSSSGGDRRVSQQTTTEADIRPYGESSRTCTYVRNFKGSTATAPASQRAESSGGSSSQWGDWGESVCRAWEKICASELPLELIGAMTDAGVI